MSALAIDRNAVREALEVLHRPGDVFEIRVPEAARVRLCGRTDMRRVTVFGYFDDAERAAAAVSDALADADFEGVYVTLNPVDPALLARAANRLRIATKKDAATGDRDVPRRRWILFDFDPSRPRGISATDAEKAEALRVSRSVRDLLLACAWPHPLAADSGNGYHLLPAVDLPADDGGLVKALTEALADRFDTDAVKLDRGVFNPARIVKVYGTRARKGDSTEARPHRMAELLVTETEAVSEVQLRALLEELGGKIPSAPTPNPSPARAGSFDLAAWIAKHLPEARDPEPWEGGTRWILERCPFNEEHRGTSAAVLRNAAGTISFKCMHNGCAGLGWRDLREHREGPRRVTATNARPAPEVAKSGDVKPADVSAPEWISPPADEWPEPADEAAFYGLAGDFVRIVEPHTEGDPFGILLAFLVAFGNAVGRGPFFRVGATRHYPVEFLGLVGSTSKGRKGTGWAEVRRPFALLEEPWLSRVTSGLSSGEGLLWEVRDPIEKQQPIREGSGKGHRGRITGYETVIEDPGQEDKRTLVVESELGRVLRVMQRDGNTLSGVLRPLWDCEEVARTMTKGSPARATGAHVSLVAQITREELLRYLDRTETANGLGNRFLWTLVRRSRELPDGGSLRDGDLRAVANRLRITLEEARLIEEMKRDDEAAEEWRAVYGILSAGRPGLVGAITGRAEAHVLRLSMLYALTDSSPVIRSVHLQAALAAWTYCEASARVIFGASLGDPEADEILRALNGAPKGLTLTDLRDLFSRHASPARIRRALDLLARHGLARGRQERTGGRPAERWFATRYACAESVQSAESPCEVLA